MRFVVKRTSEWSDSVSPCDGAKQESLEYWDERTRPEPYEGKQKFLAKGHSHQLLKTRCRRVLEMDAWTIEADLLEFVEKHGRCVVTPPGCDWRRLVEPLWTVEIYDGYRE